MSMDEMAEGRLVPLLALRSSAVATSRYYQSAGGEGKGWPIRWIREPSEASVNIQH